MIDLHSHAFQRALAGLTQRLGADEASFWTWRDTMYAFAQKITPDEQRAIAAQLQVELLKGGYTSVVEFHYLHHQPDGRAYDEPAAMSLAIHEAALETGIALTLLPVVYMQAGVDGSPLAGAQRRFALDPDGWARLAGAMDKVFADDPNRRVGLALHSVRAVPQAAIGAAIAAAGTRPGPIPIHIHIAEQPKEVRDCLERFGRRPLELLGEVAEIDQRWCLVHGTHLTDAELVLVAGRQAVVGLCPTTEADLGDGIFPLAAFLPWAVTTAWARTATWRPMPPASCGCSSRGSAWRICGASPPRAKRHRIAGLPCGRARSWAAPRPRAARWAAWRRAFAPIWWCSIPSIPVSTGARVISCSIHICSRRAVPCAMSWSAAAGACATGITPQRPRSRAPIGAPWPAC